MVKMVKNPDHIAGTSSLEKVERAFIAVSGRVTAKKNISAMLCWSIGNCATK